MFLGPAYYYLLVPFYIIFNLDPYGLKFFSFIVSTLTIFLIYLVGKDFFSWRLGLLAAYFYSISSYIVFFDRSVWNPSLLMLISLLVLFSLKKVIEGKSLFLPILGSALGFAFHIHATALFLLVITFFLGFYLKLNFLIEK